MWDFILFIYDMIPLLLFSWIDYYYYFEFWLYIYWWLTMKLFHLNEPKISFFSIINIFMFITFFYVGSYYIARILKNKYNLKGIVFHWKEKYISVLFLLTPVLIIIYPMLLWLSNVEIKKQFRYILLWIILSGGILLYRNNFNTSYYVDWIWILYFIPFILLWLFLWNTNNNLAQIIKYIFIYFIIWILLSQPFYRQLFYDRTDPENQKICYSRPIEDINRWPCFKIFKWIWK